MVLESGPWLSLSLFTAINIGELANGITLWRNLLFICTKISSSLHGYNGPKCANSTRLEVVQCNCKVDPSGDQSIRNKSSYLVHNGFKRFIELHSCSDESFMQEHMKFKVSVQGE